MQNAFDMQRKHLDKDPAFKRYYEDLVALHGRSDPEVDKFKKLISLTRNGRFDTSKELLAIRKNIKVREWGKNVKLGSWKEVVDKHGEAVAYAALRQGTLAHVPHTLLRENHGVKWPNSHQFIMEDSWWTASWREEVNFELAAEREATQAHIQQWL